jgi:hypothetical protein
MLMSRSVSVAHVVGCTAALAETRLHVWHDTSPWPMSPLSQGRTNPPHAHATVAWLARRSFHSQIIPTISTPGLLLTVIGSSAAPITPPLNPSEESPVPPHWTKISDAGRDRQPTIRDTQQRRMQEVFPRPSLASVDRRRTGHGLHHRPPSKPKSLSVVVRMRP